MERCRRLSLGATRRALTAGTVGGVAVALSFAGCGACSAMPDAVATDAASAPDGGDSALDADTRDRTESESDAPPWDGSVGDGALGGWETWAGWSQSCPLYVPGEHGQMPPPIEWEACPDTVPSTFACQRMKDTWSGMGTARPGFALDSATGEALLQFTRVYLNGDIDQALMLVAEADGPVRSALLQLNLQNQDCGYWPDDVVSTRYVITPTMWQHLSDGGRALERGAISGRLTPLAPDIVLRLDTDNSAFPTSTNWYASDSLLVGLRLGRHDAWTWDLSQNYTVYSSGQDPDGLSPFEATVIGGDVFSHVTNSARCGVMSWNVEHGSRPLLRWYGDTTHGAGNFGADGTDMVWTYSTGAKACNTDPPNPEVWTAPYTTDPAVVSSSAHRLRADVRGMSPNPYAVGFGYAMRPIDFGDPPTNALFVVRLSDGVGWPIPGTPDGTRLSWTTALGFTQTELFVAANMQNNGIVAQTIVRIRLDSLGPGVPAD